MRVYKCVVVSLWILVEILHERLEKLSEVVSLCPESGASSTASVALGVAGNFSALSLTPFLFTTKQLPMF